VGYIAGAHGIRGEVKVKLYNPESTILHDENDFVLKNPNGTLQKVTIHKVREGSKCFLVTLKGISSRNQAEDIRGNALIIETPVEDEDEIYLEALRGYAVKDEIHGVLGTIREFMLTNVDILVIKDDDKNEVLIPLLPDTIRQVIHESKTLVVVTPEGLIGE
jgi:16S rRNA processing protein RimM